MHVVRNNRILLAVVAAAAVAAGFWFLALGPKRREAADLQRQIAAKQAELEQSRQQIAAYARARESYRANYARLARLGKAVPADDDIRSLMVQLDTAARRTNVDFAKLSVGSEAGTSSSSSEPATAGTGRAPAPGTVQVGSTGISAMPFRLSFDGTYFNLTQFFTRLDRFVAVHNQRVRATGRLLRVETIELAPATSGYPHMVANVGAASYLVAPSEPPRATPAAAPGSPPADGSSSTTPPTATVPGAAR